MGAIAQHPAIDQATLAATIGFDRATIGGVIERLEAKGLVKREISALDRCTRHLSLSAQGEQLLVSLRPVVEALQVGILAPLSPTDRATFIYLARKALGLG